MKHLIYLLLLITCTGSVFAQKNNTTGEFYINNDSIMVTVIIRHQQQNNVDSIQQRVMKQKFYTRMNEAHTRILSWNVAMGLGQIVTLKFKPQYLREVNMIFEKGAWGGFTTEFYPTYDYLPVYPTMLKKEQELHQKK